MAPDYSSREQPHIIEGRRRRGRALYAFAAALADDGDWPSSEHTAFDSGDLLVQPAGKPTAKTADECGNLGADVYTLPPFDFWGIGICAQGIQK